MIDGLLLLAVDLARGVIGEHHRRLGRVLDALDQIGRFRRFDMAMNVDGEVLARTALGDDRLGVRRPGRAASEQHAGSPPLP